MRTSMTSSEISGHEPRAGMRSPSMPSASSSDVTRFCAARGGTGAGPRGPFGCDRDTLVLSHGSRPWDRLQPGGGITGATVRQPSKTSSRSMSCCTALDANSARVDASSARRASHCLTGVRLLPGSGPSMLKSSVRWGPLENRRSSDQNDPEDLRRFHFERTPRHGRVGIASEPACRWVT